MAGDTATGSKHDGEQQLRIHISVAKQEAEKAQGSGTSAPAPGDTSPPTRPYFLTFPKQFNQLGTKQSTYELTGPFSFNPSQVQACVCEKWVHVWYCACVHVEWIHVWYICKYMETRLMVGSLNEPRGTIWLVQVPACSRNPHLLEDMCIHTYKSHKQMQKKWLMECIKSSVNAVQGKAVMGGGQRRPWDIYTKLSITEVYPYNLWAIN